MLTKSRKGIVRSMLAQWTLVALIGMTLGCGGTSPTGPTPTLVTTPAPVARIAPVVPIGVYTVTASTTRIAPQGQLRVSWTTTLGGHNDWIALFKNGDPSTARPSWLGWTDGEGSGTFTLAAPGEAGQYEFRYLVDDSYNVAAISSVVTVATGAAPLRR
ncbi:MAG: hypothetical protein ABI665_04665 [Vicinamibacterales bacterium]